MDKFLLALSLLASTAFSNPTRGAKLALEVDLNASRCEMAQLEKTAFGWDVILSDETALCSLSMQARIPGGYTLASDIEVLAGLKPQEGFRYAKLLVRELNEKSSSDLLSFSELEFLDENYVLKASLQDIETSCEDETELLVGVLLKISSQDNMAAKASSLKIPDLLIKKMDCTDSEEI